MTKLDPADTILCSGQDGLAVINHNSLSSNHKTYSTVFFSIVCALAWAASFPLAYQGELISTSFINGLCTFTAFPLLLWICKNCSPKNGFRLTYFIALLAYTICLSWINISMRVYAKMHPLLAFSIMFLSSVILALFPAFAMRIYLFLSQKTQSLILKILSGVAVFGCMDMLRLHFPFGGFPWMMPAYGLHGFELFIQSVDVFGVLGLTCLLYLMQFTLFFLLMQKTSRKKKAALLLCIITLGSMNLLYGRHQIQNIPKTITRHIKAAWIQGNIPQNLKWTPEGRKMAMETYNTSSEQLVKQGAELIIWPEASVTMLYHQDLKKNVFDTDYLKNAYLIFGAPTFRYIEKGSKKTKMYQNSLFSTDKNRSILNRYDKRFLVPFGEHLPWPFSFLEKILPAIAGNFVSSKQNKIFETPVANIIPLICYESLFGRMAIQLAQSARKNNLAVDLILNATNDAWFNKSSGPYQHLVFSKFRAIEMRRSLVRAANTGISTSFNALGQQGPSLALFADGHLMQNIGVYKFKSLYSLCPYTSHCILIVILLIVLAALTFKKNHV